MLYNLSVVAIIKKCHDIQKGEVMTEEEYKQKIIMMLNDIHSVEEIEEIYTVVMWYFVSQSKREH